MREGNGIYASQDSLTIWELEIVEAFLAKLQKYLVKRCIEHKLIWKKIKTFYSFPAARKRSNFSSKSSVEPMCVNESRILCLGSMIMENSNYKSIKKKGIDFGE